MKRIIITLCLVLALATPAHAGEWFTWDETNTKLHVPLMLLLLADYRQTLSTSKEYYQHGGCVYTRKNPHRYDLVFPDCHEEDNKILGKYPKPHKVDQYFGYAAIVLTGIVWVSPPTPSYWIQGSVITIETKVVYDNYYLGAKIMF
jgi:hypothetical protein